MPKELKKVWRTPILYDNPVGSRGGCRPPPASMMKQFLSLVAGFTFTSREYISHYDITDNKRCLYGSKNLMVFDK